MTLLTTKQIQALFGTAILAIGLTYGGIAVASHSFEIGTDAGSLPDNTHIRLDGMTLTPGTIFPLYDASPNFVAGHFLIKAPCIPIDDDTYKPTITVVAGHVDESNEGTHLEKIPLYYINAVSNPTGSPSSCVYHAHIPDPLNGGSPRVTDIDLVNLSGADITFAPGDVVDINIQRVLGSMSSVPYSGGPVADFDDADNGVYNPVFDLNDDEDDNDGEGHIE